MAEFSGRCPEANADVIPRASTPTASFRRRTARQGCCASDWAPFPEQPNGELPVHSEHRTNRGTLAHAHEDAQVPILERLSPRAWLEMNPRMRQRLGLSRHDSVDVFRGADACATWNCG